MSNEKNVFAYLPGFKETIARIARVPSSAETQTEVACRVTDETNKITYKIIAPRPLNPADIRKTLVRAFSRTDVWPNKSGEIEIRA